MGQWYDGMVVPKMGVVTMGGSSYVAKNATSNPPMWTLKDAQGNRLKTESGYLLTGEINTMFLPKKAIRVTREIKATREKKVKLEKLAHKAGRVLMAV